MHSSRGRRLVAALALSALVALESSTPGWAWTTRYGHVGGPDATLRPGCHHRWFEPTHLRLHR